MNLILLVHVSAGMVGLLSGTAAAVLRKGSPLHATAGNIFAISMLSMGTSACVLAYMAGKWTDILTGIMAIYFVSTGWMTLRTKGTHSRLFIKTAFIAAVSLALGSVTAEVVTTITGTRRPDVPTGAGFVFATVLTLAAVGDFKLISGSLLHGSARLARHLWRMCFALFIASASFAGQMNLFPEPVSESGVLPVFALFPLILMVSWLLWLLAKRLQARMTRHWR